MIAQHDFPAVDAFVRWARRQYETGQQTADQLVRHAMQQYERSPVLLEQFVREALTLFAIQVASGDKTFDAFKPEHEHAPTSKPAPETPTASEVYDRNEAARIARRQRAARIQQMILEASTENPVTRFFEQHPAEQVAVPILQMTREELLAAAVNRDIESATARKRAALCREVARRLAPGQVAQEVVTETDLESIEKTIADAEAPKPIKRAS